MNGHLENPMHEAAPGDIVEVSVNLTAPNRGGTYASYWEFQSDQGARFGVGKDNGWIWAQIAVSWVVPGEDSPTASKAEQPTGSSSCEATRNSDFEVQLLDIINNAREDQHTVIVAGLNTSVARTFASLGVLDMIRDVERYPTRLEALRYAVSLLEKEENQGNSQPPRNSA